MLNVLSHLNINIFIFQFVVTRKCRQHKMLSRSHATACCIYTTSQAIIMAAVGYDDPTISNNYCENDDTDDLEKALVIAAADADARSAEVQHVSVIKRIESEVESNIKQNTSKDISYSDVENVHKKQQISTKRSLDIDNERQAKVIKLDENKSVGESSYGHAKVVATHYNSLEEKGLDERSKSRIVYMRNFHNWIKSMLINEYLTKIKDLKKHNAPVRVLDMCCGKGGDLLKWRKGNISHLICSDIASVSLEQCKTRYQDMKSRNYRDRNFGNLYSIEYIPADCTRVRLREKYEDPSIKLDLVSCQFAFHYSFESLAQAECMVKNAAECLQPGGYFIGTMPDAYQLMARIHKSNTNNFGNDVFQVKFDCDTNKPPLFGAKYNFHLDGVVDCPEFLVHFPLFVKLANKHGLKLARKERFYDFYERMKLDGRNLLSNMKSLETYPPCEGTDTVGNSKTDYKHAEEFLKNDKNRSGHTGTLSLSEWEASSLYLTFVFEKVKNTWSAEGNPIYDI